MSLSAATVHRARASHVATANHTHVPFPLPRWTTAAACVGASPLRGGLPPVRAESASTSRTFEACSGFTRVTAHRFARRTAVRLLSPGLRQTRLPSFIAQIATELYRHVLGWNLHPLVLRAFVAHSNGQRSPAAAQESHARPSGATRVRPRDRQGPTNTHCAHSPQSHTHYPTP